MKRMTVAIKPQHQPLVEELCQKLGGVSQSNAIAFLIQTQIQAALSRLDPDVNYSVSQQGAVIRQPGTEECNKKQSSAASHQQTTTNHSKTQQSDTELAFSQLLSEKW